MPPKKKTGLTWLYCSTCNCNFSSEFEKQHTDQCSEICKVQASESITGNCLALKPVANCIGGLSALRYAYISCIIKLGPYCNFSRLAKIPRSTLYDKISIILTYYNILTRYYKIFYFKSRISEDDLKPVNQLYTIYMNPDVMALFNIFDLDYVEVGGEFVATVLPDRKVSKSVVEVPDSVLKTHLKKDKLQKISVIRDVKIVKHVELFTKLDRKCFSRTSRLFCCWWCNLTCACFYFCRQEMWIERKENFRNYLRFMLG